MVIISGMERLTFEVVRSLRSKGVAVHFILNSWGNERIHPVVDELGASWSTGRYLVDLDRHTRNPVRILRLAWDILLTSLGMLRDSFRFRATHVLLPELGAVLRNAPALAVLRLLGRTVIMRVPNAPERGRFYERLWRFFVSPLVTRIVVNSEFSSRRCHESGVPAEKIELIHNCISSRAQEPGGDEDLVVTPRILFPDKGALLSDSEMVRTYSGVFVAGAEQGTSIAFGYAAEAYLDFGLPSMFVPSFLFGVQGTRSSARNLGRRCRAPPRRGARRGGWRKRSESPREQGARVEAFGEHSLCRYGR